MRDYSRDFKRKEKKSIEDKDQKLFNFILFLFYIVLIIIFIVSYIEQNKSSNKVNKDYSFDFNYSGVLQNVDVKCGKKYSVTLKDGSYYCNIYPISFFIGKIRIGKIENSFDPYIMIAGKQIINYEENKHLIMNNKEIIDFIYKMDFDNNKINGIFISDEYKKIINSYINKETDFKDIDKKVINEIIQKTSNI